jgi:hypothetical protein
MFNGDGALLLTLAWVRETVSWDEAAGAVAIVFRDRREDVRDEATLPPCRRPVRVSRERRPPGRAG